MIQIACTPKLTTGGAELLHQLCHELQEQHFEAEMIYYYRQTDKFIQTEINPAYTKYVSQTMSHSASDIEGNTVVFPEVMAYLAKKFKKARVLIYWLSVDNYIINFSWDNYLCNGMSRTFEELKKLGRRPNFRTLGKYKHIAQSVYAMDYLAKHNIASDLVSDFINSDYFENENVISQNKSNVICYNPKKGIYFTKRIINYLSENLSGVKFVPLVNMNSKELKQVLKTAKLYIDFGHHPGKDRMPREAALMKCVVITGKRGSALNNLDVLIPSEYKFDEKSEDFYVKLAFMINDVLQNYNHHVAEQENYFNSIQYESQLFKQQVLSLGNSLTK